MSTKKRVTSSVPGRCVLQGRLAFPSLANPKDYQGDKRYRFQATVIFEKNSEAYKRALAAIREVARAKWGAKADAQVKRLMRIEKVALINGDTKENYEGFAGNWAVQAAVKESTPPAMKNPLARDVPREKAESVFYPGCVVNLHVEFYAQDASKGFGERINASLRGIQFVADGDSFGGSSVSSDDEFEVIEGAEDIDDFGDDEDGFDDDDDFGDDDFGDDDDDDFGDDDDEEEEEEVKPARRKKPAPARKAKSSRKEETLDDDDDFDDGDLF